MCPIVVVAVAVVDCEKEKRKKGASQPVELTQWPKRQQGDNCPALARLGLVGARLDWARLGWPGLAWPGLGFECSFLAGDLFYVNVDMSNHSKWFRFRFSRELPHSGRGGSQLPAIKHAIAALVSDVLVVAPAVVVVAVCAASECDILRVSVSHCWLVGLKQKAPNASAHNARR